MYTPDVMRIVERHGLLPHLFADDIRQAVVAVHSVEWMNLHPASRRKLHRRNSEFDAVKLQLNAADTTELVLCVTSRSLHLLPVTPIRVRPEMTSPPSSVCDLGVYI